MESEQQKQEQPAIPMDDLDPNQDNDKYDDFRREATTSFIDDETEDDPYVMEDDEENLDMN